MRLIGFDLLALDLGNVGGFELRRVAQFHGPSASSASFPGEASSAQRKPRKPPSTGQCPCQLQSHPYRSARDGGKANSQSRAAVDQHVAPAAERADRKPNPTTSSSTLPRGSFWGIVRGLFRVGERCEEFKNWLCAYAQRKPSLLTMNPVTNALLNCNNFLEHWPCDVAVPIGKICRMSVCHALW